MVAQTSPLVNLVNLSFRDYLEAQGKVVEHYDLVGVNHSGIYSDTQVNAKKPVHDFMGEVPPNALAVTNYEMRILGSPTTEVSVGVDESRAYAAVAYTVIQQGIALVPQANR